MYEHVERAPDPRLTGLVRRYGGFTEPSPAARRELPTGDVVVILDLGSGWEMPELGERLGSFAAGLDDRATLVTHRGNARCLQVDLTPFGARALLGMPSAELAGRVVGLDALNAPAALVERLAEAGSWPARFALLDALLLARAEDVPAPRPDVAWAWKRLEATRGTLRVEALARELGCSRRHLSVRFREEVGIAPKTFARLLRFRHAVERIGRDDLALVAAECGFADQSHFNREIRAFAGLTPTELVALRSPSSKTAEPLAA